MDETMKAIEQSEFRFARTTSSVPFAPLAWLQLRQYAPAQHAVRGQVRISPGRRFRRARTPPGTP